MSYATVEELTSYLGLPVGEPPDRAEWLIERASDVIDIAATSYVEKDAAGAFRDPTVAAAMRDATCAQVQWWIATGDPDEAMSAFKYVSNPVGAAGTGKRIAPQARDHLQKAGLTNVAMA